MRDLITQSSILYPVDQPHWSLFSNRQLTLVSRSQTAPSGRRTSLVEQAFPTLRVLYQSGASSSSSFSPSSGPDPGLAVDISHGVFHSRFKTLPFSNSFPPQPSIPCSGSSPGI